MSKEEEEEGKVGEKGRERGREKEGEGETETEIEMSIFDALTIRCQRQGGQRRPFGDRQLFPRWYVHSHSSPVGLFSTHTWQTLTHAFTFF